MKKELYHLEDCPNDPQNCKCEKYWDIVGLEEIEAHLEKLFTDMDELTLFQWASVVNDFDTEDYDASDVPEEET